MPLLAHGRGLVLLALYVLASLCGGEEYATTGVISRVALEPPECLDSLFPVPGDGCGNCSVEFHVHKNVSTGTEYYTVITTEEKAASCNGTCPEGLSGWVDDVGGDDNIFLDFGDGFGAIMRASSNGSFIEMLSNYSVDIECTGWYQVTSGTVLNVTAPSSQGPLPSSAAVEVFAVMLLVISAVAIIVVFIGAYRSQAKINVDGYTKLDG